MSGINLDPRTLRMMQQAPDLQEALNNPVIQPPTASWGQRLMYLGGGIAGGLLVGYLVARKRGR